MAIDRWRAETDRRLAALEAVTGAHGTAIATMILRVTALEGQVAALEEQVAALIAEPDPPPIDPPHKVLIGATVGTSPSFGVNWASLQAAVGTLQAVRLFDPGAAGDPFALYRNVAGQGLEIHSSTKSLSTDQAARDDYYASVQATGEKVVAYTWHEPDDDMHRGDFTYDQWRAAALTDARACQANGPDYGICWQLYAHWGWPDLLDRLVADTELLELTDVIGLDTYQRGNTAYSQATYRPWSYNGDQITALMARMPSHLQVALPEFGVPEHPTDPEYRPVYLAAMHAQAVAEKWRTVLVYNAWKAPYQGSTFVSTGPEFLYDTPECREESRALLAQYVAAGR